MKRNLVALAVVCLLGTQPLEAKIINGYEERLKTAELTMQNLEKIEPAGPGKYHQQQLEKRRRLLTEKAETVGAWYRKTQAIIEMLRQIDPVLFHTINTLRDAEGNETDVYVEAVEYTGGRYLGYSNLAQSDNNPHIYHSRFGEGTVSVVVTYRSVARALWILIHELGHVRYQVPNLASYLEFYQQAYSKERFKARAGHMTSDPSHKSVVKTIRSFRKLWRAASEERKLLAKNDHELVLSSASKLATKSDTVGKE
jgi:hypothetical protein